MNLQRKMCTSNSFVFSTLLLSSLTLLCSIHVVNVAGMNLDEFLSRNSEVKDFFEYVKRHQFLQANLNYMPGTLFAPTNDAMKVFTATKQMKDNILLYHYCNSPNLYRDLETKDYVTAAIPGNTGIWVTKKENSVYVNDALIKRSDLFYDANNVRQTVHIIDEVLEPTLATNDRGYNNPTAKDLMEHPNYYDVIGDNRISTFFDQIVKKGKITLFTNFTKGTYFIPIDRAFSTVKPDKLTPEVIEGHVIPDHAIFLRTAELGQKLEAYKPTEFTAHTPVLITFKKDTGVSGQNFREMWFVNSDNRQTDPRYHKGVVQAEIVRGNIVVKNGVIHLISKPLVLIDTNVYETFEWYSNKQIWSMREFFKFVTDYASGFHIDHILKNPNEAVTLFVPSDQAMRDSEVLKSLTLRRNTSAIVDIIKSHIVHGGISSLEVLEEIKKNKNNRTPYQVPTLVKGRKLLFSLIVDEDGKKTFHVEVNGANASVIQPDIGATNGFIHIIDKVLGIPDYTVTRKMGSNPMLQLTNRVWKKEKIDSILNSTEKYTVFAPSERAWMKLRQKGSSGESAYDGMIFGNPGDVAVKFFKRLIIPDHVYSIEQLTEHSKNDTARPRQPKDNVTAEQYPLQTMGGFLKVNSTVKKINYGPNVGIHDEIHYQVYWKNMQAHVIRPNVQCTNGIIHIIDDILMDDEEIAIASAYKPISSLIGILSLVVSAMIVVNF